MFHHHLHQYRNSRDAGGNLYSNGAHAAGAQSSAVYELHSSASFFTSNPLLYVSHYSEIIVHSHAAGE